MIARNLKKSHVKMIIYKWLWMTRGNMLHKDNPYEVAKKE